jgi:hypothetical protein
MAAAPFPKETYLDSTSIVLYLKQFHAPVPDGDTNGSSARIQAVFKQLFEGRSWAMYDLKASKKKSRKKTCQSALHGGTEKW